MNRRDWFRKASAVTGMSAVGAILKAAPEPPEPPEPITFDTIAKGGSVRLQASRQLRINVAPIGEEPKWKRVVVTD